MVSVFYVLYESIDIYSGGMIMKRVSLFILIGGLITFGLSGCMVEDDVSVEELNKINNQIIEYFQENGVIDYDNYSYNYVDEENKIVVVGLVDNSKEEQEWFKKNVVNSKYIKFEQGEHLEEEIDISKNLEVIVNNGPQASSNPYDYIKASQKEYTELLKYPKETFEYAIKDLIETNAENGLKGYIEALLCREINKNFEYDFESANDYLEHYKEFLTKSDSIFNDYDKYVISLIK